MPLLQRARTTTVAVVAVVLCVVAGLAARAPAVGASNRAELAGRFAFDIRYVNGDPAGARTDRAVEPALKHIRPWISAVGASAGLADLDGDGLPNDACLVDPRDDSVTVTPTPDRPGRYQPFRLIPRGVAYDARTTAPMGCLPADLNEDGWTDALVYFWGRTPLVYLRTPGSRLGPDAFTAADIAPKPAEIRNSTTANVVDFDGDGHLDLVIGNYFPDGARVLDPSAAHDSAIQMQDSMSKAANAGSNMILRFDHVDTVGGVRVPRYEDQSAALTPTQSRAWTLATGAQDLDGDGLPELYVANDFGPDYLLWNRSVPGHIRFSELRGHRSASEPKSKVVGSDSFKSMGVAFTDINDDGRPDLVVSNITTDRGLQESNFTYVSTGTGPLDGGAPYQDESEGLGLSRSGRGWDVKAADFDGDGGDELVRAVGFVAGSVNRWAQLQELAMSNDLTVRHPGAWPNFPPDTDIAGHQKDPFFVRDADGRYVNIGPQLGIDNPGPTRGVAVADVDHDGKPDVLLANQWARSQFLRNTGGDRTYLGLRLLLPALGSVPGARPRPAVGAAVTVSAAGGPTQRQQLFPANGHTGVNAPELLFGLGHAPADTPVTVDISWRDSLGTHTEQQTLRPGWHDVVLG